MAKTGSLGDYLGLPTTFAGSYGDAGYRYTAQKGVSYFESLKSISSYTSTSLFNGVLEDDILPEFEPQDLIASNELAFLSYGYTNSESLKSSTSTILRFRYEKVYNGDGFTMGASSALLSAFSAKDKQAAICVQVSGIINAGTAREKRVRFYAFPSSANSAGSNFSWPSLSNTVLGNILSSVSADVSNIQQGTIILQCIFKTALASLCNGITYDDGLNTFKLTRLDCGYLCTKELFASTFDTFQYNGEGTGLFLNSKGFLKLLR